MSDVIRFKNMKNIDKRLYNQCMEYIKLCLLVEELQCFKDEDGYVYTDWIEDTLMKANILLLVFDSRLQRLKKEL